MANGHGGYRRPSNPAPVSGPGAQSRRTDGQPMRDLPNADYGENKTFRELQQGAPLPRSTASAAPTVDPLAGLVGLGAPTQFADQPVTAGADAGPGPGMAALGLPQTTADLRVADSRKLMQTGALPAMLLAAQSDNATPSFRRAVRQIIANS